MGPCGSTSGVAAPGKISAHKSVDDLTDYDTFFPAGQTNSLLSKFLTKERWEKFKDESDASNVSFKTCVFSGIKNLDSGIGLYAGSHDSYSKWAEIFDDVILEYHKGYTKEVGHVSNMTSEGLTNGEFNEEDGAMINSTRIRVGRNLAGFPLGPGVTKEDRDTIMAKVVAAAETFEGDLAGKFYPLEGMEPKVSQ